jgi:CubicO group peptidase (beta-lactamase class C family)
MRAAFLFLTSAIVGSCDDATALMLPDTESPTVPTSLVATALSGSEVEVVWDASTDNVAVTDYVVLRDGVELATVGVTQYTDLGVSPATTYSYTVMAEDAAGNRSSPSLAAVVTTPQSVVVFPGGQWEVRSPSELGMDGSKLDEFAASVGGRGIVVKDGYVVRTWGSVSRKEDWASAGKPVISTLLLFAIQEGLIPSVDGLIGNWGWDLSPKDESMTFYHLANMISGYARPEPPGEAWAYNDYAIRLYGLTMQNVFDTSLDEAAQLRLAPLQLEDGSLFGSRGGLGIYTSVRDFARVGWLWLNKGNWNGSQLLPHSYFDAYMRPLVPPDLPRTSSASADDYLGIGTYGGGSNQLEEGPGIYGFNWWFNEEAGGSGNLTWPDAPADAFQAAGGEETHIITIIPSLKMVVAAIGYWGSFVPGDPGSGSNQNLKLLREASAGVP